MYFLLVNTYMCRRFEFFTLNTTRLKLHEKLIILHSLFI